MAKAQRSVALLSVSESRRLFFSLHISLYKKDVSVYLFMCFVTELQTDIFKQIYIILYLRPSAIIITKLKARWVVKKH